MPVKRILQGIPVDEVANTGTLSNPEMLNWFAHYAQAMRDRQPAPPPHQSAPGVTEAEVRAATQPDLVSGPA